MTKILTVIAAVLLAGCTVLADGTRLRGQGKMHVTMDPSGALILDVTTARPLPEVGMRFLPDGSVEQYVKPSTKLEELELISTILSLP